MKKLIVYILFVFISVITCSFTWADGSFDLTSEQWQFYQTNDYQLHYSDINRHEWHFVDVTEILQTNPKDGIYGWYLVSFDIDTLYYESDDDVSLFMSRVRHADETWLNGEKIGGLGEIAKSWQLNNNSPKNMPRHYSIKPELLKNKNNLLAIKVNLGFGNTWGAMQPGGSGINSEIMFFAKKAKVDEYYNQAVLTDVVFDTCLIILGLVNFFIIIFLFRSSIHNFREFYWLLVDSIVLLGSVFLLDITNVFQVSVPYSNYMLMMSIFLTPLVISMYFWSVHQNVAKRYVSIIFFLVVVCSFSMLLPIFSENQKNVFWGVWCLLHALLLVYCLSSAVVGLKNKLIGSTAQLIGIIIFILSIRTQWLPTDLLTHKNVVVGSLIMRYALLLSYFQRINQMSYDYKNLSQHLLSTIEQHKQSIARDLHDDLGQRLSAIKLRMLLLSGDDRQESINYIKNEIDVTISAVRELMQGLHPFVLEQHSFVTALQLECQRIHKLYQVEITLKADDVNLTQENKKHLFRIFQEVVNNAIKHGKAKHIQVVLLAKKNNIIFSITDDGVGFNMSRSQVERSGFGLISLKERVAIINGHISFISKKDEGCKVNILLPILPSNKTSKV